MLKKTEDITVLESKGLNTVPNYFSLQKNQSPNMMDVKVNYDGSIEERLGSNTQNAVVLTNSGALTFTKNSTGTLTTNLSAFWKMDEVSGTRFDKFLKNHLSDLSAMGATEGIRNQAALYQASCSNYLILNNTGSITTTGNFTYSAWIYLNSTSTTLQRTIVSKRDYLDPTLLLLHCDGSNGSTSFPDSSNYNRSITATSSAQVSTAQSKFGGASALFNGQSSGLILPLSSDWNFESKDFTYDFWINPSGFNSEMYIYAHGKDVQNYVAILMINSSILFRVATGNVLYVDIGIGDISLGAWKHIECSRYGNLFSLRTDGVLVGTANTTVPTPISTGTNPVIGKFFNIPNTPGVGFNGYIDEFRISRFARHTSDFTVSAAAYSVGSSEILNAGNLYEHWLYIDTDNQAVFSVSSSGNIAEGTIKASSFGALTTSTWYNVVGWLNSASAVLGISVNLATNSASYTTGISSFSAPLVIGAISNGLNSFIDGRIDEVGYWKKALTTGERTDVYNLGSGNTLDNGFGTEPWACFDFGASSLRWLTVAAGTGLYASSNLGVTFVNIATDRSATYQYLERSKNVLIATSDAYDNPLYWAGSAGTFAVLLNPSAPLCKFSINFQGFLILLNSNTRKRGFFYIDENTQLTGGTFNNFDIPSSADDEITACFILRRYLYVSTRYKLYRVSYVGGNPDWQFIEVKNWGFIPRTAKKIVLTNNQPGVGFYYSIGEVAIGLTFDQKMRIFDGSGDQIISGPIEKDNGYCDFALEKIPYVGSGPVISFAETDPNQNIYKLCLAIGQDSTQTTHFLNYDGRALSFYPYSNMKFNCMCMAESANRRFLMAFDRSGSCHMMDSGHLDANKTSVNGIFDSPFLFEKSPSQSHKGYRTDLFLSNTSAGNIIYSDRLDGSVDFKVRKEFIISGSSRRLFHFESIDVPETYNVYQFRISHSDGDINPWRLLRWDHFVAGLGIGVNYYER